MTQRPWLKYLHWFGYVASVIVAGQLLFSGYAALKYWRWQAERRAETRMKPGPAGQWLDGRYCGEADRARLRQLPPLTALGTDGFRALFAASFADTDFAVIMRRTPAGGEGMMIIFPLENDNSCTGSATRPPQRIALKIPLDRYDRLTAQLDGLERSWPGTSDLTADGTGVVFERVRGGAVTSGSGNETDFYGKLGELIFDALRPTTPELARFNNQWSLREE